MLIVLVFACALFSAVSVVRAEEHQVARDEYPAELQGYVAGASQLEGQIMAPCCWTQTIDIHGSEIANALRREIRTRLRAGDTVDQIRDDLVSRYGPRILAVPPGNPLKQLATLLALGVLLAGGGAALFVRRWRRRSSEADANDAARARKAKPEAAEGRRDEWDERIDRELEQL